MLIPDHETEVDYLNCETISKTVVDILKTNRSRPLTIGIHGDWGAGKSSVLKMVETGLSNDKSVAVLWFNGWTFEGFDDAKTILIESTITELCRQRTAIGKVKELGKKLLKRVDYLKLAKRGSGVAFNIATGLPSPDQIEMAISSLKRMAQGIANIKSDEIPNRLEEIGGFLKPVEEGDNLPENIHSFRKEFQELLDEAKIEQLVVLIDDLDRCLPETAIQTLEAIRLFLFVPKTAFIIGSDEAMIEYAVRQHFPDLPASSGPLPYARNYLEKLIQVPFRIPSLGAQETRAYVLLLLVQNLVGEDAEGFGTLLNKAKEEMKKPWLGINLSQADVQKVNKTRVDDLNGAFVLAQQIAPMLADGTKGNPRQIKRFLNALMLRQVIAKARGLSDLISQPVLAKLMLAERFQPDFYEAIAAQSMAAADGKPPDIVALESTGAQSQISGKKSGTVKAAKEQTASNDADKWLERDWLKRWLTIQPSLGEIDLRPYVFVARDKRLLAGVPGAGGLENLVAKLCGSQLEIRASELEVKALTQADAESVFSTLRERVLSASSLTTPPLGIDGLAIVAKHHPILQGEVAKLLDSLEPKGLGLWVVKGWNEAITESQAKRELLGVFQKWVNQDDNKLLKQAAGNVLRTLGTGSR